MYMRSSLPVRIFMISRALIYPCLPMTWTSTWMDPLDFPSFFPICFRIITSVHIILGYGLVLHRRQSWMSSVLLLEILKLVGHEPWLAFKLPTSDYLLTRASSPSIIIGFQSSHPLLINSWSCFWPVRTAARACYPGPFTREHAFSKAWRLTTCCKKTYCHGAYNNIWVRGALYSPVLLTESSLPKGYISAQSTKDFNGIKIMGVY